ncbi:zinc finger HIT domain-containing protein 3-like [Anneissia japonica]|uniref:zinc finger HIT domain-containing protein 3-like n=1 Tax=Anneissia japonica TaxID=1529436 RepID=UPI0014259331|nr:zinc finger HIT domain-containing protein 3-like [Anneissia japonica]
METKECIECGASDSKYKCPKCYHKYCSVTCCKKHKESCTQVSIKDKPPAISTTNLVVEKQEKEENDIEIEDKVPDEKLTLLEKSSTIIKQLENPHLRNMLLNLDSTNDKITGISQAMQEPIFTEFADACLGIVEGPPQQKI